MSDQEKQSSEKQGEKHLPPITIAKIDSNIKIDKGMGLASSGPVFPNVALPVDGGGTGAVPAPAPQPATQPAPQPPQKAAPASEEG